MRAPLTIPLLKVAPLIETLIRLRIFCIDEKQQDVFEILEANEFSLQSNVCVAQKFGGKNSDYSVVGLLNGRPKDLLGHGHHFADAGSRKHHHNDNQAISDEVTPMDLMIQSVHNQGLQRPK